VFFAADIHFSKSILSATYASILTSVQGFLEMNNVHVRSGSGGHLLIDVDPSFLFYLAITLPLMFVTVGGWLVWDWRSMRKARAEQPLLLT
jgi:hypothetical protein